MAEAKEIKERLRNSWGEIVSRLGRLGQGTGQASNPNAAGWLRTSPSAVEEIILKRATFRTLCGNLKQSTVIQMLADEQILVRNRDRKSTVQRAIPGIKAARGQRYFVLDRKAFRAWLASKDV
jgi:hypothetical protein